MAGWAPRITLPPHRVQPCWEHGSARDPASPASLHRDGITWSSSNQYTEQKWLPAPQGLAHQSLQVALHTHKHNKPLDAEASAQQMALGSIPAAVPESARHLVFQSFWRGERSIKFKSWTWENARNKPL